MPRAILSKWTIGATVLNALLVFADYSFEWRGPKFVSGTSAAAIAENGGYVIGALGSAALLGLFVGIVSCLGVKRAMRRDRERGGAAESPTGASPSNTLPAAALFLSFVPYCSIDTSKAQVAERALAAGATTVNDVTALGDPEMAGVCARAEAQVILMHMKGTPRTMQADPTYDDVVAEVSEFLAERVAVALEAGIAKERILVDPGIGFGKTVDHNLELIERLGELKALDRPIVFGASRKSFIGKIGGGEAADRLGGTVAANVIALERGADVLRVHEVAPAREAMLVAEAIIGGWQWAGYGPRT